mgnify:CR=1 FL=1
MATGHAHAGTGDDLEGFCCTECRDAAHEGRPANCAGGSCGLKPATGCITCSLDPRRRRKTQSGTGCGCGSTKGSGATAIEFDAIGISAPMAMKSPLAIAGNRRSVRATGAIYLGVISPQGASESNSQYADRLERWLEAKEGETRAEALERGRAYSATQGRPGETRDAWLSRIRSYYATASANARAWIDAARISGALPQEPTSRPTDMVFDMRETDPSPPSRTTPPASGGSSTPPASSGGSTPASRPAASSSGGGGITTEQGIAIANAAVNAIGAAGNTVLALVREANRSDAEARQRAAEEAAARIARQDSREAILINAVTEANGAGFDAGDARRMLRAGDRAGAVAKLSTAQGRLAAALGAQAVFATSPALSTAISTARSAIADAARQIDASAPPDAPITSADNLDARLAAAQLNAREAWYKKPSTWAVAALGVLAAVFAAKR